ncbi:CHASE2 domain-containing protein [bacterium]|nr:CHASE2 domain-containing protein [bacterium]
MKKIFRFFNPLKSYFAVVLYTMIVFVVLHFQYVGSPNKYSNFIGYIERSLEQLKYQIRGVRPVSDKVVIVDMDEATLEQYGWPINRKYFADMVLKLKKLGAKVVAFDIIFADASNNDAIVSAKEFYERFQRISLTSKGELVDELTSVINAQEKNLLKYEDTAKKIDKYIEDLKESSKVIKSENEKLSIRRNIFKMEKERKRMTPVIKKSKEDIIKYRQIFQQLKTLNSQYSEFLEKKSLETFPDKIFARAIHSAKNVVLGYVGFTSQEESKLISEKRSEINYKQVVSRSEIKLNKISQKDMTEYMNISRFSAINAPHPELVYVDPPLPKELVEKINKEIEEATDGIPEDLIDMLDRADGVLATENYGSFNLIPDIDGIARNYYPVFAIEDDKKELHILFSLGLAALKVYYHDINNKYDDFYLKYQVENNIVGGIQFDFGGKKSLNMDFDQSHVVLNYYGPAGTFNYYSMKDILDDKFTEKEFKDKIVLIGTTATGLLDFRSSPFDTSQRYAGVEVHATFIENVLNDSYFQRYSMTYIIELLVLIIMGFLFGFILAKIHLYFGFIFSVLSSIIVFYIDLLFFFKNSIQVFSLFHITLPIILFVVITIFRYFSEEREKTRIKGAFKYYLSKSVVDEVLKDPSKLSLGGVKKNLSVLFSDIRGFTTISEVLTPEQLSAVLNDYLTPMTNIVFKYGGTLDKYMGDAIMAFFGAPIDQPDHAERACLTALEMMERLQVFREGLKTRQLPDIDIGIGINTGEMSVGNMGSQQRFDYTVMGDNVNLGSRLEGINKQYHSNIIVSEFTFKEIEGKLLCRKLDSVRVKGKKLPVVIYELVSKNIQDPIWNEISKLCDVGITLYMEKKWDESIVVFEKVLKLRDNDYPAQMYIERCSFYKQNPPEDGWDGVFTMTTK